MAYVEYRIVQLLWKKDTRMTEELNDALQSFDEDKAPDGSSSAVVDRVVHTDEVAVTFLLSREVR